jgi:hypothetical protein
LRDEIGAKTKLELKLKKAEQRSSRSALTVAVPDCSKNPLLASSSFEYEESKQEEFRNHDGEYHGDEEPDIEM